MPVDVSSYVALASALFCIGLAGVLTRRNPLIVLMSIELMWNAANVALIAFSRYWVNHAGHVFAFLVITVAAAEAAIGLAIVVVAFRQAKFVDVDELAGLRG
jgi:NADH-quinone oxidoreductase subunit K